MRRALAVGVFFGVLVFLSGAAAAQTVATPTRAQLQLMPLPKSVYGAEAASLATDATSGWTTNKQAAENDFDPALTAGKLARMGRITGFDVEFDDLAKASRAGLLVDADADVDLFRTQSGAAQYYTLEVSEVRRFARKQLRSGVVVDHVSYFSVPGLRSAQGIHFRIHAGGLAFWETGVELRIGVLVAGVGLGRTDTRDVRAEARRLGTALDRRIRGVLAGTVHDKPLPKLGPKLGGLGRPPGGPDLSRMTVLPLDFTGRAKPTSQRYVRNSDDVAAYVRHFKSVTFGSSMLSSLDATVELRPTTKAATDYVAVQRSIFHGQRGLAYLRKALASGVPQNRQKDIRFSRLSLTNITAGDEAFMYAATMKVLSVHVRVQLAFCVVRRGAIVETLTLVGKPNESVTRLDVVRAARTASARIDLALHG
jgi:hypothetical protein